MSTAKDTGVADLPDYAPIPQSALGQTLNDQGYFVGRVERNLYWVTDGVYQSAFLTTDDGVVLFDAPPSIGGTCTWTHSPQDSGTAVLISGAPCAVGGLLAAVTITNPCPRRRVKGARAVGRPVKAARACRG